MEGPTIKERLLKRFVEARDKLGPDWRKKLAEYDEKYGTIKYYTILNRVAGAVQKDSRASVDYIENVVVDMETILNEQPEEV